jgi:hypothetical protein
MDKHILIAGHRLDEPITLGRVEPLDGAFLHRLSPGLDIKKTRPRFLRATPQTGLSDVCSISESDISRSRNAQSIGLNPIVPDIATRNLRVSKPLARLGKSGQRVSCGNRTTIVGNHRSLSAMTD